jgi:nucleoside-triphosphatase
MSTNHLVTGPPRSGKTTVIQRTVDRLESHGIRVGGLYSPEISDNGERVGFELVDVDTGERSTLAHVDREEGPAVGTYRVAVESVDEFTRRILPEARAEADLVVVDEIASMQLHSDSFVDELELTLDSDRPVLAAIQTDSPFEFVERIRQRRDGQLYRVTPETRETLPEQLARRLRNSIE